MVISTVMKKPVHSVMPDDTVIAAAKRLRDAGVGFVPVCDRSGNLVRAITEREIAWRFVADGLAASTPVSDVMTRAVPTCRARDDIFEAQKIMRERHVRRLVCLDDEGRVVGVLTLANVTWNENGQRLAKTVRGALPPRSGA
jgi:CBS domain-containing protein